jgi:hypothetical protein
MLKLVNIQMFFIGFDQMKIPVTSNQFKLSIPLKQIPSRLEQLRTLLFHLQKIIY